MQPSGRAHIGNYFGAMKQFVDMQEDYNCIFFLADYHAMNSVQNKEKMQRNILDLALDFLAIGLDPQKCTIFKQSDVSEHTELAWILNCTTPVTELYRMTQYKDKAKASVLLSSK